MRRWKLLLPLAVAAAALITATGASTAGGAPKKIRIAVFLASAANTYWTASLQGAKDTAKKYGNVEITAFDGEFNTTKQLNQLRDALVSKKFDAWYVGPNAGEPLVATINRAIKQGVKVACTLVPCGPIAQACGRAGAGRVHRRPLLRQRAAARPARRAGLQGQRELQGRRGCPVCPSFRWRSSARTASTRSSRRTRTSTSSPSSRAATSQRLH